MVTERGSKKISPINTQTRNKKTTNFAHILQSIQRLREEIRDEGAIVQSSIGKRNPPLQVLKRTQSAGQHNLGSRVTSVQNRLHGLVLGEFNEALREAKYRRQMLRYFESRIVPHNKAKNAAIGSVLKSISKQVSKMEMSSSASDTSSSDEDRPQRRVS